MSQSCSAADLATRSLLRTAKKNPVDTAHQDAGQSLHRALFYWWQKCLADAESPFNFSGVTYTTVGYGDLVLPQEWRLLGIGDHTIAGIISPPSGRRLGGFRSFQNEQQSTRPGAPHFRNQAFLTRLELRQSQGAANVQTK
jgi:hypothetical protein